MGRIIEHAVGVVSYRTLVIFVLMLFVFLQGCSGLNLKEVITKTEVKKLPPKKVECGPEPRVDQIFLIPYEFIASPSLSDMEVSVIPDHLQKIISEPLWLMTADVFEAIDKNDIEKKKLVGQYRLLVQFYKDCVRIHNDSLGADLRSRSPP